MFFSDYQQDKAQLIILFQIKRQIFESKMKKPFDFDRQIEIMSEIFQTNISLSQTANICLSKMRPDFISRAVKQLKMDYQWLYLKEDGQKYNSIRSTLHLIGRQKVNNIDELFLDLGEQINSYYGKKLIDVNKQIPFSKQCSNCQQCVSNYQGGIQKHQEKCKNTKITAPKNHLQNYLNKKNKCDEQRAQQQGKKIKDKKDRPKIPQSKKQALHWKIEKKNQQYRKEKNIKAEKYRKYINEDNSQSNINHVEQASSQSQIQERSHINKFPTLIRFTYSSVSTEIGENDQ